jgi:glycosyltransferase involved in cell wall biosynthesis
MATISVVIITKNEAANIANCINSAKQLANDIVVVDCGSEDNTVTLATRNGARVIEIEWKCYGQSRNTGAHAAKSDWILALDADERISPSLAKRLSKINLEDEQVTYKIKRENFFDQQHLNFGTLGFESVPRLYCRRATSWDLFPVHEKLAATKRKVHIRESIIHFGIPDLQQHIVKKEHYALLSAYKYRQQGKRATFTKRFLAPLFDGAKSYIFQMGFVDGRRGWEIASTITYYTWLKYKYLHQLSKTEDHEIFSASSEKAFENIIHSSFVE